MALLFNEAFTHWVIISILLITSRIDSLNPNLLSTSGFWGSGFPLGSQTWAIQQVLGYSWVKDGGWLWKPSMQRPSKDACTSQCQFLCSSVTYSIVLYLLTILWLNKKQLGHPWWLLADCYLVPWTVLCFPFTLALVFIQSQKGQTLSAGAGPQFWLPCPVLCSVEKRPHDARTECLYCSKSLAFLFICLITQILLSLWPIHHFWLKHFGKYGPLSQPLFLLVFRSLLHIWHGNCFTQQQEQTSISANCYSGSFLNPDSTEILFMTK